jgi:hypothetical protein
MSTVLPLLAMDNASGFLLDADAAEKRMHSEVVCAQRIAEVQRTMFAHPSDTATCKFRQLVELFDFWEWVDLQEHLPVPVVLLPEVNNGASMVGGPQGPSSQW